ncbi:MAG TPA: patatin-like phospholipase family protein [Blastocatellia bacterium]|nr:patatin-like phospholipase family protein [Blastocatellia bacterium]
MARSETRRAGRSANDGPTKVAVACQGGGMHAAFAVGVLKAILENVNDEAETKFKVAGLSGTSAGALCALMAWYGLAPKKGSAGSGTPAEAIKTLEDFWQDFVARTGAETLLNTFTFGALRAEELEVPLLGLSARLFGINPYAAGYNALAACLPGLGVRKRYFDLIELLAETCPALKNDSIDWDKVHTRLLIGASEVVNGFETVFDSDINKGHPYENTGMRRKDTITYWRQQLPLSLEGVAASGTLPVFREAQRIGKYYYWDGLYSQNPPVREFISGPPLANIPDEVWIVRINPQQWPYPPTTNKDIEDRQNELMGNLSLNKELNAIMKVNEWISDPKYQDDNFVKGKKPVIIRTIKMEKETADELSYSSKFDRSRDRMAFLSEEGHRVALRWINDWRSNTVGRYPEDAGYP